jgi:hypothetical protein
MQVLQQLYHHSRTKHCSSAAAAAGLSKHFA